MIDLRCDCDRKIITLTWKVWFPFGLRANHERALRDAIDRFWNPTPPLKYYDCDIRVVVVIDKTSFDRPPEFDECQIKEPAPLGGGNTGWQGESSPRKPHKMFISPLPDGTLKDTTIAHELGHCMGLEDELRGAKKWDRNGITEEHIREIIRKGSRDSDGRWLPATRCCRGAVRHAVIDRELDWAHEEATPGDKKAGKKPGETPPKKPTKKPTKKPKKKPKK